MIVNVKKEIDPALLISYVYLIPFIKNQEQYAYRHWIMDSGAFSAHNSGTEINLEDYCNVALSLKEQDPTLLEVFALDVIGDPIGTLCNTEKMWSKGIQAIPTFHYGSPWHILLSMAKEYPKIALGGCVGKRDREDFAAECFARVWPCKIHGFGFGTEESILKFPWHSVDCTSWEMVPCAWGRWRSFGGEKMRIPGSNQNLRPEVEYYLEIERKARERWHKEMNILAQVEEDTVIAPTVALAWSIQREATGNGRAAEALRKNRKRG